MALTPEPPTPKKLLKEARGEEHQHPYDLLDYGQVIDTLFRKGFSYGGIAKWLSVRLEGTVERGQVFYIYKKWLAKQEVAQNQKYLLEQETSVLEESLSGETVIEPELNKFLQERQDAQLNAEADKEDSKRKGKRRKKP